ncbi:hypothetical protein J2810_001174 [Chryseobacterium rhizosphaerae]|uniref:reprolysin-like metallopeptidase n=1 Tax=Chryseobacterium rhizosphaerae TaxID=395937 RepID=UPI00285784E0|nr:zinc-dependent metalloprotease family protein [Chryseobacterium rhizosphaerae]MDR6545132.1 hypothetical protein [Chryseobacterium rhizosphaerae]
MKKKLLLVSTLVAGSIATYGQRWEPASQKSSQIDKNIEVQYSYQLNLQSLRNLLKDAAETGRNAKPVIISLPTAEGRIEKFAVYSNPVMDRSLVDRYQLGSYVGVGVDDPSKYLRFSTSPGDMQSMIIKDGVFQFIEPISADKQTYGVFYKTKERGEHGFKCETGEHHLNDINKLVENGKKMLSGVGIASRPTNTKYRDFRMALSATGEYSQYQLTAAGTPSNAPDDIKKGIVLAAMNNTMTRINGVFERDFGAHFTVQNLPQIIYLDAATDPYTNDLNTQLQQTLTSEVGNANYDIGHVFHQNAERSGNAGGIGIVCTDPDPADNTDIQKGSAFTRGPVPVGEIFDFTAAHEMGHQLGANHTFSMRTEASGANVEPWGGTTIMAYPGITQDNIQANMDGYFHYKSISQVLNNLESKVGCGIATDIINNTAPVITPLTNYSIPKGTAYYLDAVAADAEGDPVTYTWEQYNSVGDRNTISGDSGWGYNAEGAIARSLPGAANSRRYFPKLETVVNGVLTDKQGWETVSYIPRTLNYAITVRDQNALRPMAATAETVVTVGTDGPFKFSGLTTASVLYTDTSNIITWDAANTNNAPYNVAAVKIDYTTDNGITWTDLVASVPNTGSYAVQMPANINGAVKLRISAIGNVFYAVSPSVTVGTAPTSTTAAPTGVSATDTEVLKTTARISWNKIPGATYSVNYKKVGAASWSNTTSTVNSVLLTSLEDETNYEVQVAAVVNSVPGAFSNSYAFKTKGLRTGSDYCLMTTGGNGSIYNSGLVRLTLSNLAYVYTGLDFYKTFLDFSEDAAKVINLTKGIQYTASFRNLAGGANYRDWLEIWIDYNRNGIFENSEKVASSGTTPNLVTASGAYLRDGNVVFTVPDTAYSGDKLLRMRVASTFFNAASGPCGSPTVPTTGGGILSVGSFRDFSVRITDNTLAVREVKDIKSSEVSIYPNPADAFVEVKNLRSKADYKIYSADGRLVQEGKVEGKINVASLVKGMYVMTIKDDKNTYNNKLIKK